jgi:formylglycine-generating enzyme
VAFGQSFALVTQAQYEAVTGTSPSCFSATGNGKDKAAGQSTDRHPVESGRTHVVREKPPNGFGLFDMHRNVWGLCWDAYGEGYYKESPADDPRDVDEAALRVSRGGGWDSYPRPARSASRGRVFPGFRKGGLGFRLARVRSVRLAR